MKFGGVLLIIAGGVLCVYGHKFMHVIISSVIVLLTFTGSVQGGIMWGLSTGGMWGLAIFGLLFGAGLGYSYYMHGKDYMALIVGALVGIFLMRIVHGTIVSKVCDPE
jgi:hypothetical protein